MLSLKGITRNVIQSMETISWSCDIVPPHCYLNDMSSKAPRSILHSERRNRYAGVVIPTPFNTHIVYDLDE